MSTAAIAAGTIGAIGSLGGAAISSNAAETAAGDQSQAAEQAAQLQYQASQNALGFQEQQWGQDQANIAPWLQSGASGLGNLDYLLGITPPTTSGTMTGGSPTPSTANGVSPSPSAAPAGGPAMPINSINSGNGTMTPNAAPLATSPNGAPAAPIQRATPMAQASGGPAGSVQSINAPQSTIAPNTGTAAPLASQPNGAPALPTGSQGGVVSGTPGMGAATGSVAAPSVPSTAPTGSTNLGSTVNTSLGGFGSLMQGYDKSFQAPTAEQALNSPGEQAQMQLGEQALQQSAAAQGNLLTGGTAQALDAYGQNLASTNYQNTYNNAYNTYASGYNQFENQQTNEYNRLASLAGVGQTSAQQLGTLGQSASNNVTSNLLGTASQIGQDTQNAAAANASGVVGSANAYGGALGSSANSIQNLLLLQQLQGGSGANYTGGSQGNELS